MRTMIRKSVCFVPFALFVSGAYADEGGELPFVYFVDRMSGSVEERMGELTLSEASPNARSLWLNLSEPAGDKFTRDAPLRVNLSITKLGATGAMSLTETSVDFSATTKNGQRVKIASDGLDGGTLGDSVFLITATPTWKGDVSGVGYAGATLRVTIDNAPPVVYPPDMPSPVTNKSVSVNQEFSITNSVKDSAADMSAGLTCRWYVDGVLQADKTSVVTNCDKRSVDGLVFRSLGFHEVRLVVTDKEGAASNGESKRSWWYYVPKRGLIPDIGTEATDEQVRDVLREAADPKLSEHITNVSEYEAYRAWAGEVKASNGEKAGAEAVHYASTAWISYALGQDTLLRKAPTDEDLKVEAFEPTETTNTFEFVVSVKDVAIGSDAVKENIKKVFGLEGAETLDSKAFSPDNVAIELGDPIDGKVRFSATPKKVSGRAFFMKVRMK